MISRSAQERSVGPLEKPLPVYLRVVFIQILAGLGSPLVGVFQETEQRRTAEIESVVVGMLLLEPRDDMEALRVALEPAMLLHARVESLLPGMAEGRMAQIVTKARRLDERGRNTKAIG